MKNYKYIAVLERNGILEAQCNDDLSTSEVWYDKLEWTENHAYFNFANNEEREKVYKYIEKACVGVDYKGLQSESE